MGKIFISYKRVDKDRVFSIKDKIERNVGVRCWIDLDGIESDAQFANVIINAINNAEVFLFMYSASHAKIVDIDNDWTVREIYFAQKKKKRIVFVNIDGTPLTDWFELMFGTKQQIDALSDCVMQSLYRDLRKWLKIEDNNNFEIPIFQNSSTNLFEKAQDLYWKGNYKEAFQLFRKIAEQGNSRAQSNLGLMYRNGKGVNKDYSEAIYWYKKAAEQGDTRAQYALGIMYTYSRGVEHDFDEAIKWYKLAAEQGHLGAQKELEKIISKGSAKGDSGTGSCDDVSITTCPAI